MAIPLAPVPSLGKQIKKPGFYFKPWRMKDR